MNEEIKEIKFIEYNGIEGYIELMKHDVEPLNNPECKSIWLYYDGKDIKSVLDYITNLQQENETLKAKLEIGKTCGFCPYYDYKSRCKKAVEYIKMYKCDYSPYELTDSAIRNVLKILNGGDENGN